MAQQQQTVRITTTETSTSSALVINSGYLKTPPGLLKVAQFVNICSNLYFLHFYFWQKNKINFVF